MTVALLVIDDGRADYLERGLASARECLPVERMPLVLVQDPRHELGFAGAIQEGWRRVLATGADWCFHLESDFLLNSWLPLNEMIALLESAPMLAQVALKRQPWNPAEIAAGGIVEVDPEAFTERSDELATWTEHRRFFTTNPSVYPRRLCRIGWPQEPYSEGVFTHTLLRDPLLRFAYWGAKHAPPAVHHIGAERAGAGY